jgi:phospholipid/cholesterol/gamma-HCH transport system substrate-binding protein
MEPRVSYALVGLFVIALGTAVVLATLWLIGVGPLGEMRRYHVYLEESVAGLTLESAVKYQGVEAGSVREIRVDPDDPGRVRLVIEVRGDIPVNADTVASLATQGLTGLVYFIELRGGGPGSVPLKTTAGEDYPVIPSELSLGARLQRDGFALLDDVRRATLDLRSTLRQLRGLLVEDNQQAVRTALADAAITAQRLAHAAELLDGYLERIDPALDDVIQTAAELPGLTARVTATMDEAGAAAEQVRRTAERWERLVKEATPGLLALSGEGLPEVAPALRDLQDLAARLKRLAVELETDPGLLIHGRARRPGPGER